MSAPATLRAISLSLGLSDNALYNQRNRNKDFPNPTVGRLYDPSEIVAWREKHGEKVKQYRNTTYRRAYAK